MKKTLFSIVVVMLVAGMAGIGFAEKSWDARKADVQQLLKKSNMVTSNRFELTYAQKITDRMSNHFAYVLLDNQTGQEYLIYTVGKGDATLIETMGIAPLLPAVMTKSQSPQMGKMDQTMNLPEAETGDMAEPEEDDPFANMAIPETSDDVSEPAQ